MNNLPDSYRIERNIGWEDFDVNQNFDDSYKRLGLADIEYESDIFITYLPGGESLTVDMDRKRRAVLKINRTGHHAYPGLMPGDGYLFTIYNDDSGSAQLGTKPVRLVTANEDYLVFRGQEVMAMGPFGLIDPGNTDYGVAIFLENRRIRKIAFHRYDTGKSYEYAHTSNRHKQLNINLDGDKLGGVQDNMIDSESEISFDSVLRNVESFKRRFATMGLNEKARLAHETDRVFNLGVPYWQSGDRETALKYFKEALRIFPINTDVIGLLGDYYEYSDYDLSMQFYELAISLDSIRKKDYYQLANFYKWKGQYDKANKCYMLWELVKMRSGIDDD